jgi:hypothetical protein
LCTAAQFDQLGRRLVGRVFAPEWIVVFQLSFWLTRA